jgi:hypothetical protein
MARLSRLPPVGYANDIETGAFEIADSVESFRLIIVSLPMHYQI